MITLKNIKSFFTVENKVNKAIKLGEELGSLDSKIFSIHNFSELEILEKEVKELYIKTNKSLNINWYIQREFDKTLDNIKYRKRKLI